MNRKSKSFLIQSIKICIRRISDDELFDMIDEFRHAWNRYTNGVDKRDSLIDQTLYLIELDRRIQNVA